MLALEQDPANRPFIGQWSREQHVDAIASDVREHWIVERAEREGYLIAYDLRALDLGVYVKRIVIKQKGAGVGRRAMQCLVEHAFRDLDVRLVWLAVFDHNLRAQRSYRALGFELGTLDAAQRTRLQPTESFGETTLIMLRHRT